MLMRARPEPGGVAGRTRARRRAASVNVPVPTVRRTPVLLRAAPAPAGPASVQALALGAVARLDAGRRGLAAVAPAGGPGAARPRGRVRPQAVRAAGPGARPARGGRRPAAGRRRAPAIGSDHLPARPAGARAAGRRGRRRAPVDAPPRASANTVRACKPVPPTSRAAAAALRSRLPEPLGPLADLAYNYRWSWTPGGPELFASVDPRRWELCAGNPVRLLQEVHPDRCAGWPTTQDFLAPARRAGGAIEPRSTSRG